MSCWQCGETIPEKAEFCPYCGAAKKAALSPEPDEQGVHILLAQANLFRLRQDYRSASQRCIEALRTDPNSASAHSLLGDICQDEGRLRDAMEWYKLALSLNPARSSDREKLDRLIDKVYTTPTPEEFGSETDPHPRPAHRPSRVLFIASILSAVICLTSLVIVILLVRNRPTEAFLSATAAPRSSEARTPQSQPSIQAANSSPQTRSTKPPSPLQASRQGTPTGPTGAADQSKRSTGDRTEEEARIWNHLSEMLSQRYPEATLSTVEADPRSQKLTVTYSLPQAQTWEETQNWILTISRALGIVAANSDTTTQEITIKAHVHTNAEQGSETKLAFIGGAKADDLRALDPDSTPSSQTPVFTNEWWMPQPEETPQ